MSMKSWCNSYMTSINHQSSRVRQLRAEITTCAKRMHDILAVTYKNGLLNLLDIVMATLDFPECPVGVSITGALNNLLRDIMIAVSVRVRDILCDNALTLLGGWIAYRLSEDLLAIAFHGLGNLVRGGIRVDYHIRAQMRRL